MSFIFQMDANEQLAQPIASTSNSILLDYAPKPIIKSPSPSPERGINTWLASHGSSYYPHDQPHRGSSPRRARPTRSFALNGDSDDDDDSNSSDSDSESEVREEDAIFLQPRRHLSRQGSAMTSPVSKPATQTHSLLQKKSSGSHHHHHFHLTAQRPALPVVDLSAASGHVELDLDILPLDKSHWSDDDESDLAYDSEELQVEDDDNNEDGLWALHPDELDIPALVDDDEDEEGNPASTSTRSIPIPSATKDTRRLRPCFDVESSPPTRRKSSDGQSFWTPWMDQYLAGAAAAR